MLITPPLHNHPSFADEKPEVHRAEVTLTLPRSRGWQVADPACGSRIRLLIPSCISNWVQNILGPPFPTPFLSPLIFPSPQSCQGGDSHPFLCPIPSPQPGMLFLEGRIWGGAQERLFSILNSKAAKASTGPCPPGTSYVMMKMALVVMTVGEEQQGWNLRNRAGQTEQDYHLLNPTPKSLPATKLLCLCPDFHSNSKALSSHPGVLQILGMTPQGTQAPHAPTELLTPGARRKPLPEGSRLPGVGSREKLSVVPTL